MVKSVFFYGGWTNKQGATILLRMTILMGFFLLAREVIENFLKPRLNSKWKIYCLFLFPALEIFFSTLALYGYKQMRPKWLLPLLCYKIFYFLFYFIASWVLLIFVCTISHEQFINVLKNQLNMEDDGVQAVMFSLYVIVFISTLIFPMEKILNSSFPVVISVYALYSVLMNLFQLYFAVVIYVVYLELKKEKRRDVIRRYVVNPAPRVTYTTQPVATTLPKIDSPPKPKIDSPPKKDVITSSDGEKKHQDVAPNVMPVGTN